MKVLLMGAAGFIGMHCAKYLLERGDQVVGIDNLNDYYDVNLKKARLQRLADFEGFTDVRADIGDQAAMNEIFDYGRPQRVTLVSLIDLDARELPIQPDIIGTTMPLNGNERVKLQGPSPLSLTITTVEESLD